MPIHCPIATQRITQDEFKQIADEVMRHVFTIHNEFGRFFDEQIYTRIACEEAHWTHDTQDGALGKHHTGISNVHHADGEVAQSTSLK